MSANRDSIVVAVALACLTSTSACETHRCANRASVEGCPCPRNGARVCTLDESQTLVCACDAVQCLWRFEELGCGYCAAGFSLEGCPCEMVGDIACPTGIEGGYVCFGSRDRLEWMPMLDGCRPRDAGP